MTAGVCFACVYCYRFGFLQMEFQICLHFCVSFGGEQLRDLGGQIYKVELIISIGEARVSLLLPLPSPSPPRPHFCLLWFHLLHLQVRRQLVLADVLTRSHIQFCKQMFIQPHFTSALSFSESRPCGNRLEQHKGWNIKNLSENLIAFMCSGRGGWCGEGAKERNPQSKILWVDFFFIIYSKTIMCWTQ